MNVRCILVLTLLLAGAARAQNVTRNITDRAVAALITRALEESDKLAGTYAPDRYAGALYLVDVAEDIGGELSGFRAVNARGTDIIPARSTAQDIQYLLGENLAALLRTGSYDYERIRPDRIAREFAVRELREQYWRPLSAFELSADRVSWRLAGDAVLTASQGDPLLGLPGHLGGFTRVAVATRTAMAGVLLPFAARVLGGPERRLDAGLGGFAAFSVGEGAIGAGGLVYFQRVQDASTVNFTRRDLTLRSPWGGYATIDVTLPLSDAGPAIRIGAGFETMAIERGAVVDGAIRQVTTDPAGNAIASYETTPSPLVYACWSTGMIAAGGGASRRLVHLRAGYVQRGVFATLTVNPASWLGVRIETVYHAAPRDWEPDFAWMLTPVIQL